jgi:hypothetical protein
MAILQSFGLYDQITHSDPTRGKRLRQRLNCSKSSNNLGQYLPVQPKDLTDHFTSHSHFNGANLDDQNE